MEIKPDDHQAWHNRGSALFNLGRLEEAISDYDQAVKIKLKRPYCSIYVTIEEQPIDPTNEQAQACLRVCQMLSNCYRDIQLFRFDDQTGIAFIFAGEELQIIVPPNGLWRFLDATEL